jgi:predicted RNase H-like HicB family nuclease
MDYYVINCLNGVLFGINPGATGKITDPSEEELLDLQAAAAKGHIVLTTVNILAQGVTLTQTVNTENNTPESNPVIVEQENNVAVAQIAEEVTQDSKEEVVETVEEAVEVVEEVVEKVVETATENKVEEPAKPLPSNPTNNRHNRKK